VLLPDDGLLISSGCCRPVLSRPVTSAATSDIEIAKTWVTTLLGEGNPALFFLSPLRFETCERTPDSLSFTLSGTQRYGQAFGPSPPINSGWTRCSIDASPFGDRLGALQANDRWDFYSLDTTRCEVDPLLIELSEDDVIREVLERHAPHSQVWPGNPELVSWFGLNDPHGELASLAALVRWESGLHVLSSVVTVTEMRARGYARRLVGGIGGELRRRGHDWLGLGVAHDNAPAKRVYEQVGFVCRAHFTTYSLESSS
jgi:GNAT superfamily N-acetyltransferase